MFKTKNFNEQRANLILTILKSGFILIAGIVFYEVWEMFYQSEVYKDVYYALGNYAMAMFYPLIFFVFSQVYGGMKIGFSRIGDIVFSNGISVFFASGIMYLQICLVTRDIQSPVVMLLMSVVLVVLMGFWAWICNTIYFKMFPPKDTLILYENLEAYNTISKIGKLKEHFNIVKSVPINSDHKLLKEEMKKVDCVFICGASAEDRNFVLKYCTQKNIKVYLAPKITDIIISGSKRMHLLDAPLLYCDSQPTQLTSLIIKRLMDVVCSGLMLLVFSPFMLLTAIAIKAYDKGPVFFKQKRLTKNGKEFDVYKFRSMIVDAEKDGVARLATTGDDRITPVGKFIRKTRLDELPQLINIFNGDMSIVGPRPERPEIASVYEEDMPEFALRLQVKAGLTGYAQIYGKYNTTPYNKLQMDLMYIAENNFILDLKIMLMTFKIMFISDSTEGIEEGHTLAGSEEEK